MREIEVRVVAQPSVDRNEPLVIHGIENAGGVFPIECEAEGPSLIE